MCVGGGMGYPSQKLYHSYVPPHHTYLSPPPPPPPPPPDSPSGWPQHCFLSEHTGKVTCLLHPYDYSVAYDSTHLLSGAADFTVRLWDLYSGTLVHTFSVHGGEIQDIVCCPPGINVSDSHLEPTFECKIHAKRTIVKVFKWNHYLHRHERAHMHMLCS